jgi:hypothetical protein
VIIYAVILFTATLTIDVATDYRRWLRGKPINHTRGVVLRLIGLLPAVWCLALPLPINFKVQTSAILMTGFLYMNLFDGLFNILRGFPWFYAGSNGPEDGKIENLLQKYPWLQAVKIIGAVVAIVWYVIIKSP